MSVALTNPYEAAIVTGFLITLFVLVTAIILRKRFIRRRRRALLFASLSGTAFSYLQPKPSKA